MATIIKNKKAYDSGDVSVFINGVPINISEISYETEQEHQLNYTLKDEPTSWSRGKKSYSASVTLFMEDVLPLEEAGKGDLLSIKPFPINVTFVNEYNKLVNDTIVAKFQKQGREVSGDMGLSKQYDLFVLGIEFNNA
jgi:hypothetical protein